MEGDLAVPRYDWGKQNPAIDELRAAIEPTRITIVEHPIYHRLHSLADVNTFTEHHVFAVWDFMSLLKSLQRNLTCVEVPWVPRGSVESRRLINDITLVEVSDEFGDSYISHLELYVNGMEQAGADTTPVTNFLNRIRNGEGVPEALDEPDLVAPAAASHGPRGAGAGTFAESPPARPRCWPVSTCT